MEKDFQEILRKKNIKIKKKQFKLNFFQKSFLDSIQFLELVSLIEKKYKINFSNKEISNNKFYSINGIMACLKKKLHVNKKKY